MAARGRPSLASLSVASENVLSMRRRPDPWPGLNERETELWTTIVDSQSVDWFSPGDTHMLAELVRSIALSERVSAECDGADLIDGNGKMNELFKLRDMLARAIANLSVKLRLSQSAKWTEQKAHTKSAHNLQSKKPWET